MSAEAGSKRLHKIRQNYSRMRTEYWPHITDEWLWLKTKRVGYTPIPRVLPYVLNIMDTLAGEMRISSTYLALWCRSFDEAIVVANDQEAMAAESGFAGNRAVSTWKMRMKKLVELKFIATAEGRSGKYNYVLILNPFKIVKLHYAEGNVPKPSFNALYDRAVEVGAEEDLMWDPLVVEQGPPIVKQG
ncbi:MAG: hypothetical protein ACLQVJ_01640 [Syntrophobacteraceae bacterium]